MDAGVTTIPILTYHHILRDEENTRFAIRPLRSLVRIQQPNDCFAIAAMPR